MTIFLTKYKSIYNNINLKTKTKAKKIPKYYNNNIIRKIRKYNI